MDELNHYDQFWLESAALDNAVGEEIASGPRTISRATGPEPIPDIVIGASVEVAEFVEQDEGIVEPDFDVTSWKKAVDADQTEKALNLLAYSRPKIEPYASLVAAEIVRDADTMINVIHGKITGTQFTFLFLDGLESVLEKKVRANLGKYLNKFPNLECLGLRKAGIRRLDKLSLPKLNRLIISYNLIADASALGNCVSGLPGLQILDFRENPILYVKGFDNDLLPLADHSLWQTLLVKCPLITHINDCLIDPGRKSRAMALSKTKAVRNGRAWDIFLLSLEQIPDMARPEFEQEFAASAILSLDLHEKGLSAIWMHRFVHVRSLNLVGNELVTIDHCGLEKMQSLQDLNLSHNRLKRSRQYRSLNVLALLSSLQRVWLQGNVELKDYRSAVIYITRQLRGTNRTLGLLELDERPITIEERVHAVAKFRNKRDACATRWRLNLILEYGHQQMVSIADFLAKITTLSLSDRSFDKINVTGMPNLQLLNVARNQLSFIEGLQTLSKLRILDAVQNPSFHIGSALKQLKSNECLERVAVSRLPEKVDASHIRTLLTAFLPKNARLSILEGAPIDFLDRMGCLAKIHKTNRNIDMDVYRANLALLQCATPLIGRNYSYEESAPGKQYQPTDLKHIQGVSHFDLKAVDVGMFTNLVVVDLSFNSLSSLPGGLLNLQKLEQLDLRSNKINITIKQLADIIDCLGALEILHIRGNPFMRTAADRAKLIASISRMKQVECSLRTIDSPVSVDERVDSWLANGGSPEQAETLRYRAAIFQRVRKGMDSLQVVELDLSCTNIAIVLLSAFLNLRKLNLRQNRLQLISGTDIDKMAQLRVLDLGQNQLSNLQDVVVVVNCLPQLIFLVLAGNPFPNQYRSEFLRSCCHFARVSNKLLYIDHEEVSVSEIINSHNDLDESFRFDLAVYRRTSPPLETKVFERQALAPDHEEVIELDLSHLELKVLNMHDFSSLRCLRLSNNQIETNMFSKSCLESCKDLEYLYLDHNQLTKLPKIVSIISRLLKLRVLDIISNPCFPEPSKSDRHKLLKEWPNIEKRSFPLRLLDGAPVTVRERIKAATNIASNLIEETRLDLTIFERQHRLENGEIDLNQTSIDLSSSDLQVVKQCFSTFRMLQEINLNDNSLTSIADQGLESLSQLRHLRLCRNQFPSLDNLLETLSLCHALKVVHLEQATTDGRTKIPESYLDVVGFRLRGVAMIDDQANPNVLEGIQLDAQQFLWNVAGVGPNQCVYVDISNRNIAAELFFYVIAALAELRSVTTLKSNGNQWNRGEKRILNYRQFIIFGLGRALLTLDDEPISDDERLNAIEFVHKDESRAGGTSRVHKGGWVATKDRAVAHHQKITGAQARKEIQSGPDFSDNKNVTALLSGDGAGGASLDQIRANMGSAAGLVNESVHTVGMMTAAPLLQVTGSVLVKFEIMINFLQMYSLIYAINVTIPWPKVWVDFSQYFLLLSIDVDFIFPLHWKDLAVLKYIATLAVPLVFVGIYILGDSLDVEAFRRWFVTQWKSSRAKAIRLFVIWAIISAGISAAKYRENIDLVWSGHLPNPEFNGLFVTIMTPVVALLTFWSLTAWRFRSNCIDVEPNEFLRWWYTRTYFLRRVSLFALTILFMPVARIIMQQFQCHDGHLVIYPERLCVNDTIYPVQITAFGFAAVYIIGLPMFFGRLISKATKMIDSHGYADEAAVYNELIAVLSKQAKHDKDIRKKIKDAHEHLDTFYANEVAQNPVPQTYLYGAYQRRFRYFKLLQMFQKLAVVLLTMFIPQDFLIRNSKLFLGNVIVLFSAILAIAFRPFQDKYESILEILSQVANTANITTAILLDMGFPSYLGAAILVTFNGLSWATFAFTVLAAPVRALLASRTFLKQQRLLQEAMKAAEQLAENAVVNGKEVKFSG